MDTSVSIKASDPRAIPAFTFVSKYIIRTNTIIAKKEFNKNM